MGIISISKASPVRDEIEDVTINIAGEANVEEMTLDDCRKFYREQGKQLSDALFSSLPGGTIDALLCEMMTRRASLFVAPLSE